MDPNSKKFDQNDKVHSVLQTAPELRGPTPPDGTAGNHDGKKAFSPPLIGSPKCRRINRLATGLCSLSLLVKDHLVPGLSAMVKAKSPETNNSGRSASRKRRAIKRKDARKASSQSPATQAPAAKKTLSPSVSGGDRSTTPSLQQRALRRIRLQLWPISTVEVQCVRAHSGF